MTRLYDMARKITDAEEAAAQKNYASFRRRFPAEHAKLKDLIEGQGKLHNDPRLIRHFAESDQPPTRANLVGLKMFDSMREE